VGLLMLEKLKKALPLIWPLPQARDLATNEVSFRMWCAWWSFHLAAASCVALHFWPVETATWTAVGFFGLCMVFYMLKKLTSATIDFDDKFVKLQNESKKTVDNSPE